MTVISSTTPSTSSSLAQLISGGSSSSSAPAVTAANPATSAPASQSDAGPATFVTLSEQAKAAAAARVQADQAAADSLQAYVAAHHVNAADIGTQTNAVSSLNSLLGTSSQQTSAQPAGPASTSDGSQVQAIVTQIATLTGANQPQQIQSFTPAKSLSNSVTVDGYTLTLNTNASTQFYGIEVSGNGVQAYNKHFGPDAGAGGVDASPPGVSVSAGLLTTNQAVDAITITQNAAAESSASISSSAGSATATAVNAQSSSITFLVNYATGQITVQQSLASVSARSTETDAPASTLSTFA